MNKSRLKWCVFFHYILFLMMLIKLSADILDKLDIFILEIEELEIPKPLLWEYIWAASIVLTFLALTAIKKNRIKMMNNYIYGTSLFGCLPAFYGIIYYYNDVNVYASKGSTKDIMMWQGLPCGLLWYGFILIVLQIHIFSMYFASNLITAWSSRGAKKSQ